MQAELKILRALNHENIVRYIDGARDDDALYIFLEYCTEGDLQKFIVDFNERKASQARHTQLLSAGSGSVVDSRYLQPTSDAENRLTEDESRYIIKQIVAGLAYLHSKRIVHRDIKLDNILITRRQNANSGTIEDYIVKIGDMGFAKEMRNDLNETLVGTPLNMAPEMLVRNECYDAKVDIWSLGTILFQMLVGKRPFSGKSLMDLQRNVELGDYKIPSHIKLSRPCLDFIHICLQDQSKKRATFEALLQHEFLNEDR